MNLRLGVPLLIVINPNKCTGMRGKTHTSEFHFEQILVKNRNQSVDTFCFDRLFIYLFVYLFIYFFEQCRLKMKFTTPNETFT